MVRQLYDSQLGVPGTEYKASHILVESKDEAVAIIAELDGGADFAELAKAKSTGPSGPNGGQLGWFSPAQMVKPFSDAAAQLEARCRDVSFVLAAADGEAQVQLNPTGRVDQYIKRVKELLSGQVEELRHHRNGRAQVGGELVLEALVRHLLVAVHRREGQRVDRLAFVSELGGRQVVQRSRRAETAADLFGEQELPQVTDRPAQAGKAEID